MTTSIIISRESIISAEGAHVNGNSKSIYCETTGESWPSITDAAIKLEVAPCYLSYVIRKGKPYKGKMYKYMSDAEANIPAMLARIKQLSEMEVKAKAYDDAMNKLEEARKAEEKHLADIAKKEAELTRRREITKRKYNEYLAALDRENKANDELEALKGTEKENAA